MYSQALTSDRKYPYSHHRSGLNFLKVWQRFGKTKKVKEMYEAELEFTEGFFLGGGGGEGILKRKSLA